jgi:predicted outer membrane repeat protein
MPTAFSTHSAGSPQDIRAAGGAVYVQGSQSLLTLDKGIFAYNRASHGGAVAQLADSDSALDVRGPASFSENVAKNMGGAMSAGEGVKVTIRGGTFFNNSAIAENAAGGGLYCQRCGHVVIIGSNFTSNSAPFGGGAALLQAQGSSVITNTQFVHNVALPPRLINDTMKLLHQEASLEADDTKGKDAALFEGLQVVDNTTIDSGAYGGGGGLYVSLIAPFDINGSIIFQDNVGLSGGE